MLYTSLNRGCGRSTPVLYNLVIYDQPNYYVKETQGLDTWQLIDIQIFKQETLDTRSYLLVQDVQMDLQVSTCLLQHDRLPLPNFVIIVLLDPFLNV